MKAFKTSRCRLVTAEVGVGSDSVELQNYLNPLSVSEGAAVHFIHAHPCNICCAEFQVGSLQNPST